MKIGVTTWNVPYLRVMTRFSSFGREGNVLRGLCGRCSAQLYLTEQWAWGSKALEGQRTSEFEELMLELLVLWSKELKRLQGILVKLGLEAPQCAQL